MNIIKILYWASTGLLTLLMLFSAGNYFFKYEMVHGFFEQLGYPTYIIYPLAVAKILGLIAILSRQSKFLLEWAYAGFFFDVVLAFAAHYMIGDGGTMFSIIGIVLVVVSRFCYGRLYGDVN